MIVWTPRCLGHGCPNSPQPSAAGARTRDTALVKGPPRSSARRWQCRSGRCRQPAQRIAARPWQAAAVGPWFRSLLQRPRVIGRSPHPKASCRMLTHSARKLDYAYPRRAGAPTSCARAARARGRPLRLPFEGDDLGRSSRDQDLSVAWQAPLRHDRRAEGTAAHAAGSCLLARGAARGTGFRKAARQPLTVGVAQARRRWSE